MVGTNNWLLPDGVDEVLPPHSERLEKLRRQSIDLFESWGYRLVIPPIVEFLESLLSSEDDLDLQTLKITDQQSGRMMGVRADITPQVARIDAHRLATNFPQRLCYIGPVIHAKPDKFAGSRNPLQIGAELYGHTGIESDAEVMCLMAEMMRLAHLEPLTLELGHMGVFKALINAAQLEREQESILLTALLRKTESDLRQALANFKVNTGLSEQFIALMQLNGDPDILDAVRNAFANADPAVAKAIRSFTDLVRLLRERIPKVNLHLDLAELRGYHYHTGITFAAYAGNAGRAIGWGGRYDNIGRDFGRARAATGFSADLKTLVALGPTTRSISRRIFAPAGNDAALLKAIADCRQQGEIVVQALSGQAANAKEMGCDCSLVLQNNTWVIE